MHRSLSVPGSATILSYLHVFWKPLCLRDEQQCRVLSALFGLENCSELDAPGYSLCNIQPVLSLRHKVFCLHDRFRFFRIYKIHALKWAFCRNPETPCGIL